LDGEIDFADFPPEIIRQRRVIDADLDEILRDYELLLVDLQDAVNLERQQKDSLQADLRESLAGLKMEILTKLRSC